MDLSFIVLDLTVASWGLLQLSSVACQHFLLIISWGLWFKLLGRELLRHIEVGLRARTLLLLVLRPRGLLMTQNLLLERNLLSFQIRILVDEIVQPLGQTVVGGYQKLIGSAANRYEVLWQWALLHDAVLVRLVRLIASIISWVFLYLNWVCGGRDQLGEEVALALL